MTTIDNLIQIGRVERTNNELITEVLETIVTTRATTRVYLSLRLNMISFFALKYSSKSNITKINKQKKMKQIDRFYA